MAKCFLSPQSLINHLLFTRTRGRNIVGLDQIEMNNKIVSHTTNNEPTQQKIQPARIINYNAEPHLTLGQDDSSL